MAATIGTVLTIAAAARVAGPLFRVTTTAAQRLMANHAKPQSNVDYIVGSAAGQNNVPQSSNSQGFLNAINQHNKVSAVLETNKTLSHVSNVPTLKPKGSK